MKCNWLSGGFCGFLALVSMVSAARAETRTTLDVSAGMREATNPYLVSGKSTDSTVASFEAKPSIEVKDDVSTFTFNGAARLDQYFRRYGTDFSGRADVAYDRHISELTHVRISGGFASTMGGSRDLVQSVIGTSTGPVINPNSDVTAAGSQFRQYDYGADLRLFSNLSSHDIVELGGAVHLYDAGSSLAQPYREFIADATYRRAFSELLTVGPKVSYTNIDYRNLPAAGGEVITPALAATYKFSETLSLSASAGASIASLRQPTLGLIHTTNFVGDLSLCDTRENSETCLRVSRSVGATSAGGVMIGTSVDAQQSWKLSDRDSLKLSASYARSDQQVASVAIPGVQGDQIALASATYTRQLSERLFLDLSPQFEKLWGQVIPHDANFAVLASFRYRFGQ